MPHNDRHSLYLTISDQTILQNVFNAYSLTCGIVGKYRSENLPVLHSTIHTFFNDFSDRHRSLVEYFKKVPEFVQLSMDDKVRLLRNHFGTMLNINESIIGGYISTGVVLNLHNVFGQQLGNDVLRSMEKLNVYGSDPILLKLVLIVRSLSSGMNRFRKEYEVDPVFDDPKTIFRGQSRYIELLWRYILARAPSDDEAVKFFNKLVLDLLFLQRTCYHVGNYVYQKEEEIERMEPVMQCMWPRPTKVN